MSNKSNRWLVVALTIPIAIGVTAFFIAKRLKVERTIHQLLERRAADMAATLNAGGAKVGEPHVSDDVQGAEQVVVIEIDGKPVRLLEYDPAKEAEAKEVHRVHQGHTTNALGVEQSAEDEGPIVIVDFDKHPLKDKILEAFHKSVPAAK